MKENIIMVAHWNAIICTHQNTEFRCRDGSSTDAHCLHASNAMWCAPHIILLMCTSSCPESTIQKIWRWLCLALKSLTAYSEHIFLIYVFLSCMEMKILYTSKALVTQLQIHLVKHLASAGPEEKNIYSSTRWWVVAGSWC